jgi:hypothetical protein
MLRTTSAEWTPSARASAQAASTAAKPSVNTADSTLTIWRSPSSKPAEQIADEPRRLVPALDAGGHHLVPRVGPKARPRTGSGPSHT